MSIKIYTDGACRGNPGPGGWGALLRYNNHEKHLHEKHLKGAESHTTNNRMELTAAIRALEALKRTCQVDLYTDSTYLKQGMQEWLAKWKKKGWVNAKKQPIKNADLWQILDKLASKHQIKWHWVKGHSGHPENEQADALANEAIDEWMKSEKVK